MGITDSVISRRTFLTAAVTAPLLGGTAHSASRNRPPAADDGQTLPNVLLQTHDGRSVRFYDDLVKGRMVMINMMYTNCANICPPNTASLLQVKAALGQRVGRDVFMYSLTLQPEFDRPEDLQRYMRKYRVGDGWTFLTGAPKEVDFLRRRLGFYNFDPAADADLKQHTGMVRIGHDARGRWSMVPATATTRQITDSVLSYL